METQTLSQVQSNLPLDPSSRMDLVMSLYKKRGYINRQALIDEYKTTQIQAGILMREFINMHAQRIVWNMKLRQYTMSD